MFDSNFPGNSLWPWEFHPLNLRLCLSQTLRNPESYYGDWPYGQRALAGYAGGTSRPLRGSRAKHAWRHSFQKTLQVHPSAARRSSQNSLLILQIQTIVKYTRPLMQSARTMLRPWTHEEPLFHLTFHRCWLSGICDVKASPHIEPEAPALSTPCTFVCPPPEKVSHPPWDSPWPGLGIKLRTLDSQNVAALVLR